MHFLSNISYQSLDTNDFNTCKINCTNSIKFLILRSGAYSPLVSSGWPSFVLASPVERQAFGFSIE
jgi:hypothetical protein